MNITAINDQILGQNTARHRYDLPLENDSGTGFLIILIGLMSFLSVMALAGVFITGNITDTWSSGLSGKMTLEIPAEDNEHIIRDADTIKTIAETTKQTLETEEYIEKVEILDQADVENLVKPWLGEVGNISALPLPGLLSIHLKSKTISPETVDKIKTAVHTVDSSIHVDTHEEWLDDIISLASALELAVLLVTIIISAVTVTAIATAMQARMEIHREDIELLHLMGARDEYIARQFQRHARILGFKGAVAGMGVALLLLLALRLIADGAHGSILPQFSLSFTEIFWLIIFPIPVCFLASWAVRFTTLRALSSMP